MVRTGIGYDSHAFAAGRALILGGIEIPHEAGLAGHSDADVLTHAIIDALLGAAGLGDIGRHFPDSDEQYRDADSMELLRTVVVLVSEQDFVIGHVDATVAMDRPRLDPYRELICQRLAEALRIGLGQINVKATSGEGMGFVGRGEGAAAIAVATLERAAEEGT
jgi:2-C-methyl-D-erythritol 2,4-cyclodiphosphate synthase